MFDMRKRNATRLRVLCALFAGAGLLAAVPQAGALGVREEEEPVQETVNETAEDQVTQDQEPDADEEPPAQDDAEPETEPEADEMEPAESPAESAAASEAEGDDERDDPAPDEQPVPPGDMEDMTDMIVVEDLVFDIHRAPIELPTPTSARELAVRIEADRRLLSELRKEIPYDRAEAELYLRRIRELAAISDPVSLVPMANNVIRQAPALFEWLETEYDDPDERARDYYIGGSWAFHRRFEAFRKAVLLTVIRRLDAVGDLLQGDQ